MDLSFNIEDKKLNIRAAAVIIHENRLLTHININLDHYSLLGGRVELGENSEATVKREIQEELGKDIIIEKYITTVENFFQKDGKKYHEILFIYKAEFSANEDKKITHTLDNAEGKSYLKYEWIDLDEIEKYNFVPKCLIPFLKYKNSASHIICKE